MEIQIDFLAPKRTSRFGFSFAFSAGTSLMDKSLYAGRNNRTTFAENNEKPLWANSLKIGIIGLFGTGTSLERVSDPPQTVASHEMFLPHLLVGGLIGF
jgi:hypothetical protein